ncbi:bifunctional preprotein translocase subunit SecD/SecF [Fictibacillus macauensis ZFHKF-1]|uniref:Protein-export membrane protein SecF n=1 Tax=Fictibacillus macauensis ZFHKF-1 TaxID=1196324 RepID=I8UEH5_9BACL|nr:bifunctional preprotein translocase subunit SecD/SecF [Fictibacillus macauensis ZFHKF-1]
MSFRNPNFHFDVVKQRKKFFLFSGLLTIIGIVCLLTIGLKLGIDFESGTRVEIGGKNLNAEQLKTDFKELSLKPDGEPVISGKNNERATVSFIGQFSRTEVANVNTMVTKKYGSVNINTVSPDVGRELARNALISVLIASIGIIIYISFRFEWLMSISAIVGLLHNAFLIVAVFSILRLEVDLTFIAAVLTIVGYSVHDTIITFDRIRENMKFTKVKTTADLYKVINDSIMQTLTRSINTVVAVLITVVALLIFGNESIRNFSIALLIGLVFGTYASICIASQLWYVLKSKQLKKPRVKEADNQA